MTNAMQKPKHTICPVITNKCQQVTKDKCEPTN